MINSRSYDFLQGLGFNSSKIHQPFPETNKQFAPQKRPRPQKGSESSEPTIDFQGRTPKREIHLNQPQKTIHLPTNILVAAENGWLEYDPFLLGRSIFRGKNGPSVSGRLGISSEASDCARKRFCSSIASRKS